MAANDNSPPSRKRCRICGEEADTFRERNLHESKEHYGDDVSLVTFSITHNIHHFVFCIFLLF